ncbi:MAG: organic hydroperoxide resistance protein [Proteiniphilum sp.]|jgi:Ohr subfamily peroxiredoxin|uniref:organic hydroperoxide resistance protein n=1 Tax=Proteiniphilum sp. TaxID=1926877 RepID=UPI00092B9933|nr:organic hydroperoxide resistance protein [Proteiniphilum sp.]MEA5127849.1 organic hydroperoxide resistance protein [Proteiniphilum sp.]OJV87113.1 MAG: organic hydroperoxide resistance protein [Bacteroidia bacterium 44-10]
MKALYTAIATAIGGREGRVRSSDGMIDLNVQIPKEMGGRGGATNPEQLFAAGYAACFDSALNLVLRQSKLRPESTAVTAEVSIGSNDNGGFGLSVKLAVEIKGIDPAQAREATEKAHQVCPYSNATRGNIDVDIELI